ncbi:MAG: hypothetical protein CMB80_33045 [Flammeovirgaceae bacterium]|nr:hypothetical protein [Flammeovirgaceae bacterium]MBE62248.1 hypothetical protein [Flammeovirgaceae bacterium]MBR10581.1 hypothetical protein [Rickettsiales bacterium]HCX23382.1 hypothetical protein [Cytophagales bacterium]|tara:strand:- start:8176 stop:8769 length:594 start_codon:yes stop_codon:yes gene_type:complete
MSKLEFFNVFQAIIYGLAVAEVLMLINRMIREYEKIKFYWAHLALIVAGLLFCVQWYVHGLRALDLNYVSTPIEFIFFNLLIPSCFYVIGHQITPPKSEYDFEHYLLTNRKKIFLPILVYAITVSLINYLTWLDIMNAHFMSWEFEIIFHAVIVQSLFVLGTVLVIVSTKKWVLELMITVALIYSIYIATNYQIVDI